MSGKRSGSRQDMPKKKEIVNFWYPIFCDMGLEMDDELLRHYQCFVCAVHGPKLERAHIKALCDGGSNDVRNLHMLCASCHHESEMYSGRGYWAWFHQAREHKAAASLKAALAGFAELVKRRPELLIDQGELRNKVLNGSRI